MSDRDANSGRDDDVACEDIATLSAYVGAARDRRRYLYAIVLLDNDFDRDDSVGALRYDAARRHADRLALAELDIRRPPGERMGDDLEHPRRVLGADGIAVHGGAGEGRQIRDGKRRAEKHTIVRVAKRDRLDVEWRDPRQHGSECVGDRDEPSHDATLAAVWQP